MRKKVLAVLLAGTMALAMGACGQGNGTETSGTGESSSGETDSTETDSETGETADEGEEVERRRRSNSVIDSNMAITSPRS